MDVEDKESLGNIASSWEHAVKAACLFIMPISNRCIYISLLLIIARLQTSKSVCLFVKLNLSSSIVIVIYAFISISLKKLLRSSAAVTCFANTSTYTSCLILFLWPLMVWQPVLWLSVLISQQMLTPVKKSSECLELPIGFPVLWRGRCGSPWFSEPVSRTYSQSGENLEILSALKALLPQAEICGCWAGF